MTYLRRSPVVFSALFLTLACSAGTGSGDSDEESAGSGGTSTGDGDPVQLGDGDGDASPGDGDMVISPGDGDGVVGDGDGDLIVGGSGGSSGSGGADAAGTGGTTTVDSCVKNPSGSFVPGTDVVFDERTCLTWTRANTSGDPYAAAITYCDGLVLGGYDDWRIPTAGEAVSIFKCDGMWPPIDDTVFNVSGDGFWTSTETGTIAGNEAKVCGAGQSSGSFYDFGPVGGQNTRCVRGVVTLPDRTDCKTNTQICQ